MIGTVLPVVYVEPHKAKMRMAQVLCRLEDSKQKDIVEEPVFHTHHENKKEENDPLLKNIQKQMVRLALSTTGLSKEKSMTESSETVPLSVQHE